MRILLDQAVHDHRNRGNNALLEAAYIRLRHLFPNASFSVISIAPHFCRVFFPELHPVEPTSLREYQSTIDIFHRLVSRAIWKYVLELRERLFFHSNHLIRLGDIRSNLSGLFSRDNHNPNHQGDDDLEPTPENDGALEQTMNHKDRYPELSEFDLYVTTGGGYLCDSDDESLLQIFDRLEAALDKGVPVVMVGQGVGPIEDKALLARAGKILPSIDLILYRNQRLGLPCLKSLGIHPENIKLTGDDAIDMAYASRPDTLGSGIGVSVRLAAYTQVTRHHLDNLREVLHQAAIEREAPLVAIPISFAPHESDLTHIHRILDGYKKIIASRRLLGTYHESIRMAGLCRLTISGTYHGAVFSLAQGVPVIGIASSVEYFNKLSELSDEFGPGCQVISLQDKDFREKLSSAIDTAWLRAEELRPMLLASAARQIEAQRAAYDRIYSVIQSRHDAIHH